MDLFSLTAWSRQIPAGFLVSRCTWELHRRRSGFRIRGYHPLWPAFPDRSANRPLGNSAPVMHDRPVAPSTPPAQRVHAWHAEGLGSSGFARRYCRNHCCFLFLWVLRWFTSPRSPPRTYGFSSGIARLSPGGVPPFGHSRITVRVQLPGTFRSLPRPSSRPSAKAFTVNP
jgi:hypothetical protein